MKRDNRFIQNISANTLQMVMNQGLGLLIFYVLSRQLDKTTFGNFNWALAVLLTSFGILSCGIDQLVVKKIATGENVSSLLSVYLLHVLAAGGFFYSILLLSYFLFPSFYHSHYLLLFLSVGKLFAFFSTPFKQLWAGLEKFRLLLFMSVGSNIVKASLLLLLYAADLLSIEFIVVIFIAADFIELIAAILLSRKYLGSPLRIHFNSKRYKQLFREALPQLGTVIFSAAMARMDWILIGIFLYAAKLAEYSFAYKIFEVSTFPLLIIAPLLIPLFARVFRSGLVDEGKLMKLKFLLYIELAIASFTSMILVIIWVPFVDFITNGKYGSVNRNTVFILSLCIPFLYFNNFMWTINFARAAVKKIFFIFAATFIINAAGDVILIPMFKNEGAAAAYFMAMSAQSIFFLGITKIRGLDKMVYPLVICPICALSGGLIAAYCFCGMPAILITSILIYLVSIIVCIRVSLPQLSGSGNALGELIIAKQPKL